jgi:NAD(P)-dependent dehydrogenase (short-subunit alcohol dehydrogenase family)
MASLLKGKSYLVTGSTDGIGRHTAEKLYRAGAHVMIHGRNAARVKDVVDFLNLNGTGTVSSFVADLSDLTQVRRLATEIQKTLQGEGKQLTCLINNAGVYEKHKVISSSGLELTWAVNVAAPFLLTSLLLAQNSIEKRIVNVASVSASSSIDFDNLQQEKGYSAHNAYSLSKLADIMFSIELAERLARAGSPITSNTLDPGTVNTKMLFAGWGPIGNRVQDADDQFFLATDGSVSQVSGRYFISSRGSRAPSPAYDVDARRRLWDILEEQTGAQWNI